jgi:hypothetical protein
MVFADRQLRATSDCQHTECKHGSFPFYVYGFTYRGAAITAADWGLVTTKVAKRADQWTGKLMSSVARLTLINACFSNLPMHAGGMFVGGWHLSGFQQAPLMVLLGGQWTKAQISLGEVDTMCKPKALGVFGLLTLSS